MIKLSAFISNTKDNEKLTNLINKLREENKIWRAAAIDAAHAETNSKAMKILDLAQTKVNDL